MRSEKWGVRSEKWGVRSEILIILLLTSCFLFLASHQAWGKTKQEELKGYRDRIKEEKKRVRKVEKKEKSVLSELELMEKSIKEKEDEFKYYDSRLRDTEKKIEKTEGKLTFLHKKIEEEKGNLRGRLRSVYKQGRRGYYYGVLIGAKDSEDLFRRYKYLKVMANHDRRLIESYNEDRVQLKMDMTSLEKLREEVSSYRETVKKKEEELKTEKNKKLILLGSFRTEKSTREKLIQELEEAAKRVEALIKDVDRKADMPIIPGLGFSGHKGRLPWPNDGKLAGLFGRQTDPEFHTPIFKRGIEIQTRTGDDIRAIYKGSVIYSDWFKGYGKMLIINHGERYYSLYAHASEIFPRVGETVSEGQVIGKVGDTGSIRGTILYFEIRHRGEPQDPLVWLMKK